MKLFISSEDRKFFEIKSSLFFLFVILICNPLIAQWTYQSTITGIGPKPCISVYGPNEIVAAGGPSGVPKVFKSTNGGVNWTDISGNLSGPELWCVWAVNGDMIFAGDGGSNGGNGGNARVWKTTNGGVNWSVIFSTGGSAGFFNGIVFSRTYPLIGLAQSDPPTPNGVHYLQKTTDGGNTWNIQNTISTNGTCVLGTVVCIDNLFYAWAGYPPARIVLTSDGGTTWIQRNISNANYTSGVAFSSDKTTGIGESSGFLPNISRSTDGGNTWTQINTGLPNTSLEWGKVKWVYGTNTVFLTAETGASGCIGKSTNAGLNWSVMSTAGITNLYNIDLVYTGGMVYAYAISLSAQVIKLQEPVTGIGLHSREVPSEYRLEQNYPNPFNPTTNIKFEIINSKSETNPKTEIRIYDVLGKEVATLINENLKPGSYEVEWDASSFPSGVYFYRLTSGKFSETKKMILNK